MPVLKSNHHAAVWGCCRACAALPIAVLAVDSGSLGSAQVAFLAGLMYTIIGLLRLGWITQYLSQPVISGFMSGACITIAMSQVLQQLGRGRNLHV